MNPESKERKPVRHWIIGGLSILVVLALIAFVPGPVFQIIHSNNAHKLVDDVSTGRTELRAEQDEFRAPLVSLGTPDRSWTQVSCWLSPRYSDGDGEQDIVMFYWQECSLVAYEVYALPPDSGSAAEIADRLGGHTAGEPTCAEVLFDVLTPDYGASRPSEYATALWWVNPGGQPPPDQPDRCTLPTPDDPDAARVERGTDEPTSAETYILYKVSSPVSSLDVGCARHVSWLSLCAGEPDGFPAL